MFVSGCSSGIGRATVIRLLSAGWVVFASVRRDEDARSLKAELRDPPQLHTLLLDISDEKQVEAAAAEVKSALTQRAARLCAIVCNAGYAGQSSGAAAHTITTPALARSTCHSGLLSPIHACTSLTLIRAVPFPLLLLLCCCLLACLLAVFRALSH